MSNKKKKPYYGIRDSEIQLLPVSPDDLEFIKTSLNFEDARESWASVHDNQEINQEQGVKLAENMKKAQQVLLNGLLFKLFGRMPPDRMRLRHLTMRGKPDSVVRWVFWKSKAIAMITHPITYAQHSRYFLRWYWKEVEK